MSLRTSLPRSLIRSAHGSLNPPDVIWEDTGGGTNALVLLTARVTALSGTLQMDYRKGVTPDAGAGFSWQPIIGATAFTHVTGAACPTLAADGVNFARASSQFCAGALASTYFATTAGTLFVIVNPLASDSNLAVENTNNAGVAMTTGNQNLGVTYRSSPVMQLTTIDNGATAKVAESGAITNGALQCWEVSWSNSDNFLRTRVAGVDGTPKAYGGTLGSLATGFRLGVNSVAGDFYNGKIQGVIGFNTQVISTPLRAAVSAAYGGIAT